MRTATWAATLAVLAVLPCPARAQRDDDRPGKAFRKEIKIAKLMGSLRDEMWAYRQELYFFRRAPQYDELLETRYRLRNLAIRVADLEDEGRREQRVQRELAKEMQEAARELKKRTDRLEDLTDAGAPKEVRRRADRLKERADDIEGHITRLHELIR